jgi:hypothetical protein
MSNIFCIAYQNICIKECKRYRVLYILYLIYFLYLRLNKYFLSDFDDLLIELSLTDENER